MKWFLVGTAVVYIWALTMLWILWDRQNTQLVSCNAELKLWSRDIGAGGGGRTDDTVFVSMQESMKVSIIDSVRYDRNGAIAEVTLKPETCNALEKWCPLNLPKEG